MNVPEKWRPLAHEWVEGAEIERYSPKGLFWFIDHSPIWDECAEYRIKPKPKVKKWRYWYASTEEHYTEEDARVANFGPKIDGSMIEVEE